MRTPFVGRSGSAMPLKFATPRKKFGFPYSSLAIDCRVSPSEMRCVRRALIEPEVGFWGPSGSEISFRLMSAVARSGFPVRPNIVYLTLTFSRENFRSASWLLLPPKKRSVEGWCFLLLTDILLGAHQANSWATCLVPSPIAVSQSSKKICMLMVCGSLPRYSGFAPAFSFMFRGGVCHLALFVTEYSVGLNVNSRLPAPSAACSFARTIFDIFSSQLRNPLWASSSVSVAIWLAPMSSDGPVHFTGKTPSRVQV